MIPDLGRYAAEVIAAYLVSLGLIVALVAASLRHSRRVRLALRKVEEERQARVAAAERKGE